MHKKNNHENHRNDKVEKHESARNEDSKCPRLAPGVFPAS